MSKTYVLGLDVSMNSTGWAVLSVSPNGTVRLVETGVIKANTKHSHGQRLRNQRENFAAIMKKYPIKYAAREAGFARYIKSTQVLFKAYGVAEEYFCELDLVEYAPRTIKKVVAGKGKSTKEEVEKAIREILQLRDDFEFKSDDESDAVAVAITLIKDKILK